jgi:integral membrane protein
VTSTPSSGALIRYRVMAYVTGVVLATSCLLGLSFWPWYVGEGTAGWLWTAHGYLYIVYVVTAFLLALRSRWPVVKTLLVMAAGTVPLMSFVAERRVTADLHHHPRDPAPAPAAPAPPA